MKTSIKFCKNCKHFSTDWVGVMRCEYPHEVNLVTGKSKEYFCEIERFSLGRCKPSAIYFEEKITLAKMFKKLYNSIVEYLKRSTITLK